MKGSSNKKGKTHIKHVFIFLITVTLIMAMTIQVFADAVYYIVKPGDSLTKIAKSYNVEVDTLVKINGLKDKNFIFPGQKLLISETSLEEDGKNDSEEEKKEQVEEQVKLEPVKEKTSDDLSEYLLKDEDDAPEISITMLNASVSDILSMIAINLNEYIFYVGQEDTVTFILDNVKPRKALELFLNAVQPSGQKLSYIRDGDILIVGPADLLQNNFFNEITLTDFKLNYIPADVLSSQISALGFNFNNIYLDTASNHLFVQGTPQELAKVAELISILDKKEYFPDELTAETKVILKQYDLKYITADMLSNIVSGLQIEIDMITVPHNPKSIWINGDSKAVTDFLEVKNKMDIAKNAPPEGGIGAQPEYELYQYNFTHIVYDDISEILSTLLPEITIMPYKLYPRVVLVYGKKDSFKSFLDLVDGLDQLYLADKMKYFFHTLYNVTADYAAERIDSLGLDNVTVNVLNVSQFGKDLLVVCPDFMHEDVKELLWGLDVKGTVIRVPVDYSSVIDGQAKLEKRRDLLVVLTGLYKEQFYISGNVSRGDGFHFVMYIEGTPEEIQLVSDMIAKMDSPA